MPDYGISIVVSLLLFALAVPYVERIRHPEQKPRGAHLIFHDLVRGYRHRGILRYA